MNLSSDLEKENATGQNQSGANANRPVHILTASSIIGDNVENKLGESIGKIKDIMLNTQDGRIQYLVIEFGGFIGFGEKLFAIPFSAVKLNVKNEDFVLNIDKAFLEKAPGFDKDHWPETNSHYFDVNSYWGSFMGPNTGV
ncbi:MAG TPA: PRC-barrel domain-containing protein [Cyclobacteriaceae bacterium]|jgi:sporulation protein YlmC with PRC-barrel domain|nr:PRC-barrel domain-containing protein [Cyclobacteriaceae bacterium]